MSKLNNNNIIYLNKFSFYNLHELRFLNLSANSFVNLPMKCFFGLLSLRALYLGSMILKEIHMEAFTFSNVKIIMTLDYKLSCISLHETYCTSHPLWYVSCSDILPGKLIKAIYITVSLSIISLNALSILLQFKRKQGNDIFKIKVIGINLSDTFCGVYLLNMWLSDVIFQRVYLVNQDLWKSHSLCFVSHGIIMWFIISSPICLISLSVSRLIAIVYPLKSRIKSQKDAFYQLSLTHLFAGCLSIFLTLVVQFTEKRLPTSLCLPFIDPSGISAFTKVISWITIVSQSIFSVIISIMHTFLIIHVNKSLGTLQKSQSLKNSNKTMLSLLILTSTSNIVCWFPVNAVYISAMFLSVYPINLVIWTTVAIMPVNSMINPSVFVLMNLKSV